MSNLFVDKISGKSGTSSGAPITLSGDTATLGSGVTVPAAGITGTLGSGVFPSGHVINMASYSTRSTTNLVVNGGGADFTATQIDITVANASSKMIINYTTGQNRRDSGADGFTYIKRTVDPSGSPTTTFVDGFADGEGGHLNKFPDSAGGDHGQSFFTIDTHGQTVGTVIRYFIRAYAGTVHANYYVRVDDTATHHGGYVLEVMT